MNIAFLSSLNPTDIHNWSGTLFYMWKSLEKHHKLSWIGKDILDEIRLFHYRNFGEKCSFIPEKYAMVLGKKLSEFFHDNVFDIIICRDYFFLAYLLTDIPVIYIGDTTFRLFNSEYLKIVDQEFVKIADNLECFSLKKAAHIVYSSEWAKNSAMQDYGISSEKISVIEFGANIDFIPLSISFTARMEKCNLLFIGGNWIMKGGPMAIDIFRELKKKGIPCSLTIIGCMPDTCINDEDIRIFSYIDKATEEGELLFAKILKESHFLVAPTLFDCFGIMFCEAAAFGIPSFTISTGGVPQAVRNGVNGFIFPPTVSAKEFSDKIFDVLKNAEYYKTLRESCRREYEKRLNWDIWSRSMNKVLNNILCKELEYDIPLYVLIDKKNSLHDINQYYLQFPEFNVHIVEDNFNCLKIINELQLNGDEVFILCNASHRFSSEYSLPKFIKEIQRAYDFKADLLLGYVEDFDLIVPMSQNRFYVQNPIGVNFIVVYASLFEKILRFGQITSRDMIEKCIESTENKLFIYPFFSSPKNKIKLNQAEIKLDIISNIYSKNILK